MKDDEVYGVEGTSYTAEYWQYDSRLGRRWNVDPLIGIKPWLSPYHAFSNKPIVNIDPNGALEGDYWKYNKETDKMEHEGSDGIDDGKNWVLHDDSPVTEITSDNYTQARASLYPDQNIREFINKQSKDFVIEYTKVEKIEGETYRGTFREIGGFAGTLPDGTQIPVASVIGDESIPLSLNSDVTIGVESTKPGNPEDPSPNDLIKNKNASINLIWHIHSSAVPISTGSSGTVFNTGTVINLWKQTPSEADYNNVSSYESQYFNYNGGTAIQISTAGKGMINFYNSGGITTSIPINVFTKPLIK